MLDIFFEGSGCTGADECLRVVYVL